MSKKKKEDKRPKLIILEDYNKTIVMKFGPEKFQKDLGKMTEILIGGVIQTCVLLGKNTMGDIETQKDVYNYLNSSFISALQHGFPEVVDEIMKEENLQIQAIEAAESGSEISEPTKEAISRAKEKLKSRFKQKTTKTVSENLKEMGKKIQEEYLTLVKTEDFLIKHFNLSSLNQETTPEELKVTLDLISVNKEGLFDQLYKIVNELEANTVNIDEVANYNFDKANQQG